MQLWGHMMVPVPANANSGSQGPAQPAVVTSPIYRTSSFEQLLSLVQGPIAPPEPAIEVTSGIRVFLYPLFSTFTCQCLYRPSSLFNSLLLGLSVESIEYPFQ